MRRLFGLLFLCATANAAEPTFIQKLDGLAAQCAVDGSRKYTEAELALRDHGESSKQYKAALGDAYTAASSCVQVSLPKGRDALRSEALKSPNLKERLADAYAAWVGYMDWLKTPHSWADDGAQKSAYETARNRLQAEIDIQ
ncbi:hypothetical protein [Pseudomonas multiresinivorans]|uniref:DUF1311 domain-containing protein n=1 Tax=Pseudomonas multiresinivorans TaxID=95301 RepID=A0A7Z3GQ57_9PSED|nr:hypothetical protein [Pseudomonas multiresinivorans]QJP08374.1 hypothetical protein G4G71_10990 [Pseudomonas multiresinivorans]